MGGRMLDDSTWEQPLVIYTRARLDRKASNLSLSNTAIVSQIPQLPTITIHAPYRDFASHSTYLILNFLVRPSRSRPPPCVTRPYHSWTISSYMVHEIAIPAWRIWAYFAAMALFVAPEACNSAQGAAVGRCARPNRDLGCCRNLVGNRVCADWKGFGWYPSLGIRTLIQNFDRGCIIFFVSDWGTRKHAASLRSGLIFLRV